MARDQKQYQTLVSARPLTTQRASVSQRKPRTSSGFFLEAAHHAGIHGFDGVVQCSRQHLLFVTEVVGDGSRGAVGLDARHRPA